MSTIDDRAEELRKALLIPNRLIVALREGTKEAHARFIDEEREIIVRALAAFAGDVLEAAAKTLEAEREEYVNDDIRYGFMEAIKTIRTKGDK